MKNPAAFHALLTAFIAFWLVGTTDLGAQDDVPTVSGLQFGVHDDRVRLRLNVVPTPAFALFTLNNPDRLVVDFPALNWNVPEQQQEGIPFISSIRYGLFRQDRARVVMDLAEPVSIERAFTVPERGAEPGRLVVDLAPTTREAFDARAGLPEQARWHGDAPPVPAQARKGDIVVAIDPGHGGIDPGAKFGKFTEKSIVLEFSKELAAAISARPGMTAYLIRDRDEFVPLAERVARAHLARANVMLSIHADSVESGKAHGMSLYTLSAKGSDQAANALAARENRADVIAGADLGGETDDLTRLLVELAQRGTKDESSKLAKAVLMSLRGRVDLLRTRPHRQANFRVLKAPDIPSLLVELGFLDSKRDRKRLKDPEWRQTAINAIVDGINAWREEASPGFLTPR
ncbi:MAG: N-acetylmuramoyl-L-alanine amidase [Pseudomonadota bacterium]